MTAGESFPTCDHLGCEHPYRREYCTIEAKDVDGQAVLAIEAIENLLYQYGKKSLGPHYMTDGETKFVQRTICFAQECGFAESPSLLETEITIAHQHSAAPNRDAYVVHVKWTVHQENISHEPYQTIYTLEEWPHAIIGTIDEYDLSTERLKDLERPKLLPRSLTLYDLSVLKKHLKDAEEALVAADNETAPNT